MSVSTLGICVTRWRIGASTPSALLDTMSFGNFNRAFKPARTAFDWLSRDPAEVDAYVADPRCGFKLSAQGWIDLLDALPGLADPKNLARGMSIGTSPEGPTLKFVHRGSYDNMDNTYEAITNHLDEKKQEAKDTFIEEYVTDPLTTTDPLSKPE